MELVGIGDLHLDKLDALIPDASELICKSIDRVCDYALNKGIKYVLFYGDICERPRLSYHSQALFYKTLLSPKYKDLEFHIILGNHDFAEDNTHSLQVLEMLAQMMKRNIKVYTKREIVELDGVKFNFLPYPFTETEKGMVNVGHFEVSGSLRDNGRKIDEGLSTKHVTLMGHLHTKHKVRNTYYSGTLYQTNFGEVEKKFFHHVEVGKDVKNIVVNNIPFKPPWRLVNLTVNDTSDLKEIDKDPRTLYKLFLKDGADIDLDKVLTKYPNVVKYNTFKSKKDLEILVQQSWEFDSDIVEDIVNVDDMKVVREFLSAKGLKKNDVLRAMGILDRIKGNKV